jgi:hypothetical protein
MKKATREWVRKAEADFQLAAKLDREAEPFYDHRCFLCQQSSEKYLKALLEERAILVAKTHDLERLLNVLLAARLALSHRFRRRTPLSWRVEDKAPGAICAPLGRQGARCLPGKLRLPSSTSAPPDALSRRPLTRLSLFFRRAFAF